MDDLSIVIGHENFGNYRRLAYKWWYALAEFVDNSTQSFLDNDKRLREAMEADGDTFHVRITQDNDLIRVTDNAMGMDRRALERALMVGVPPDDSKGRCRYGLGMKTAACWIGNEWKIVTTRLGDPTEYTVSIDVEDVMRGVLQRPTSTRAVSEGAHYTKIEIRGHNHPLRGRTIGKVKDHLSSIYRVDLARGIMSLFYNDDQITWDKYPDEDFLQRKDGSRYKRTFIFEVETEHGKKVVEGWVGVLQKGSRSKAGFSILHRDRVIKGWPDSWRPEAIFGHGGRNDLINQRLVGEVNLEDFEVTHTKDDINWYGREEEAVEDHLRKECSDFLEAARKARKGVEPGHGPDPLDVDAATKTLEEELCTPEFLEKLDLEETLPPDDQIDASNRHVVENASRSEPRFTVHLRDTVVKVYIDNTGSPNDPYFVNEDIATGELVLVVNQLHPHWSMLEGENAVVNYLRHCVYDGVAGCDSRASRDRGTRGSGFRIGRDRSLFDLHACAG